MSDLDPVMLEIMRKSVEVDPDSGPSRQAYIKFVEGKSADEVRWWSSDTVAVVTGSNKGIGYEIVRQLATKGVTVILTARDESRGNEAIHALKSEGLENVLFHPLEVTNLTSAEKLASWIKEKFGGFDILIGNAGISGIADGHTYESAKSILNTNYEGQKIVAYTLLPLLRPSPAGARIIFVSSELGQLKYLNNETLRKQLNDVEHLTVEDVDAVAAKYLADAKEGKDTDWIEGFGPRYKASKILLNAFARVFAKTFSTRPSNSKVYVNLMTPGLTGTDLNNHAPGRTLKHAADTAVWLALLPSGGPNGGFFRDRADYSFEK